MTDINKSDSLDKILNQKRTLVPNITIDCGGVSEKVLFDKVKRKQSINSRWLIDMMTCSNFTVAKCRESVDLVSISLGSLGFTDKPSTREFMTAKFCADWSEKCLDGQVIELCMQEVGPQLFLQCGEEEPKGETVYIAMVPIVDSEGDSSVFSLTCKNSPIWLLDPSFADKHKHWNLNDLFFFRLRKISKP